MPYSSPCVCALGASLAPLGIVADLRDVTVRDADAKSLRREMAAS